MNVTISKHNVFVVESEKDVLKCLAKQIITSKASQVLVTGPMAGHPYWEDRKEIDNLLSSTIDSSTTDKKCAFCGTFVLQEAVLYPECGKGLFDADINGLRWNYFGPPYSPSRLAIKESLDSFANTIKFEPRLPHIYIGPTYEEEVIKRLFFPSLSHPYKCAVYVLGIYEDPITHLNTISKAVSGLPHMTGNITSIFSTSDKSVTNQFKRRLAIAHDRQEDIRGLILLYFKFLESIKWLAPENRKSADRKFIRNVKKTLKKEIIPKLYPKELFPEMKVKPWWRFW